MHQCWQEVGLDGSHVGFRQDEGLVALLQQPEQRVERKRGPLQMRQLWIDLRHAEEDRLVGPEASRPLHAQPGVVRPDPPLDARAELVLREEDEVGALPRGVGLARGEPGPVLREEGRHLDQLEFDKGHHEGHLHPLAAGFGHPALKYRRRDAIPLVEVGIGADGVEELFGWRCLGQCPAVAACATGTGSMVTGSCCSAIRLLLSVEFAALSCSIFGTTLLPQDINLLCCRCRCRC